MASGLEVGRYWWDRKRKSQEKSDCCLARISSKMFVGVSVDLLVCARSHLSSHSMHVLLPNFEFEVTLEIPSEVGGGTCGRERGCRQHPWACSLSLSTINTLPSWMLPLVTKPRDSCDSNGADTNLLPLGVQKNNTSPIS